MNIGTRAAATHLQRAAERGETVISTIRAAFTALLLLRVVVIAPWHPWRTLLDVAVLGVGFGFSVWVLGRARRSALSSRVLLASAVLDAAVCTLSLLPNVLWPWPTYPGLLRLPDPAGFAVVAAAAGFRLSLRAAVAGGGAALGGAAFLLALDAWLNGGDPAVLVSDGALFFVILLTFVAIGISMAGRTSSLVERTAAEVARAERSRSRLGAVLREHHHVRTVLSSAVLRVEQLRRVTSEPFVVETSAALTTDLERVRAVIERVKGDAVEDLHGPVTLEAMDLFDCVVATTREVAAQGVNLLVKVRPFGAGLRCWALGGRAALERFLFDLLVNAADGDGERGATTASIEVVQEGPTVQIIVEDDGPGFVSTARPGHEVFSSKAEGSGVGLLLARDWVEASGGRMAAGNRAGGGARIMLELPQVEAA